MQPIKQKLRQLVRGLRAIGPQPNKVLGVVANWNPNKLLSPFGGKTSFYETLVKEAAALAVDIVFFSPVGWKKGDTAIDAVWLKGARWQKRRVQIPEVIYDRFFPNQKRRKLVKRFRRFLTEGEYKLLAPYAMTRFTSDKNKFNQFMVAQGIPCLESHLLREISEEKLQFLLASSSAVYLKPTYGMKGQGIVVLEKLSHGQFLLHSDDKPTESLQSECLSMTLQAQATFKNYIVQPKADSFLFEEAPFFIRVLIQNQGNRNYRLVGMLARVGASKSWTAVPCAEEKAFSLAEIADYYRQTYGGDIFAAGTAIEGICLKCCDQLHEKFGEFAEMAFDVMLTQGRGPVVLEANTKPGRAVFRLMVSSSAVGSERHEKSQLLLNDSLRQLVIFALSKFSPA